MGSLDKVMSMLPIAKNNKAFKKIDFDQSHIDRMEAIINSMTVNERRNPDIINGNRKKRIAMGSGNSVNEVNKLLKQFAKTKQMMKNFSSVKGKLGLPFGDQAGV